MHGTMSIIKKPRMLLPKITKARAVQDTMPLITHSTSSAKRASAQVPGHPRFPKPALLNRQRMGTCPAMEKQPELCDGHGQLIYYVECGSTETLSGLADQRKYVQSLARAEGAVRGDIRDTAKPCHTDSS